jgi:hypothetical protein
MTDASRPDDVPAFDREQLRCPLCGSPHFQWERITPFRDGVSSTFWGVFSETLELDMASCTACRHVLWFRA